MPLRVPRCLLSSGAGSVGCRSAGRAGVRCGLRRFTYGQLFWSGGRVYDRIAVSLAAPAKPSPAAVGIIGDIVPVFPRPGQRNGPPCDDRTVRNPGSGLGQFGVVVSDPTARPPRGPTKGRDLVT